MVRFSHRRFAGTGVRPELAGSDAGMGANAIGADIFEVTGHRGAIGGTTGEVLGGSGSAPVA